MKAFGPILAKLRRPYSQRQLAKLAGLNRQRIEDLEAGKTSPRLDVLEQIAGALEMELAAFLRLIASEL